MVCRRSQVSCITILLEKGARRDLTANNGETAIDLAEDDDTYKALAVRPPSPTLKRKRNLSTDSAAMEAALPTIAET